MPNLAQDGLLNARERPFSARVDDCLTTVKWLMQIAGILVSVML